MKKLLNLCFVFFTLLLASCGTTSTQPSASSHASSPPQQQDRYVYEDLSRYFSAYKTGTFVLYDEQLHQYTIYNDQLSRARVSPYSTFKVVHALIGLETGVLKDENTVIKWNGTHYMIPQWNHDQTLASAVHYSVVWYFQHVATVVGPQREQYYLNKIPFGNADISGGLTKFWLGTSLQISPREQVEILKRMYHYNLPFSRRSIDIVKKVITLDTKNGAKLSGKTGSSAMGPDGISWFIGYVEAEGHVYYFATEIRGPSATGLKAEAITSNILHDKKIFG